MALFEQDLTKATINFLKRVDENTKNIKEGNDDSTFKYWHKAQCKSKLFSKITITCGFSKARQRELKPEEIISIIRLVKKQRYILELNKIDGRKSTFILTEKGIKLISNPFTRAVNIILNQEL